MLSSLLTSGKQAKNSINDLFSKKIEIIEKEDEEIQVEIQGEENQKHQQNEEEQEQLRQNRTLFVGNVNINAKKNDIRKLFNQYGEIEKVWFRSIPVDRSTKKEKVQLPMRIAVLMGKLQDGAQSQNCYILFKDPKSVKQALQQDGQLFMNQHLRCTLEGQKKKDHIRTAFVGNLPFNIEEEELRKEFENTFGPVNYVRVIRDPQTHTGKGFGYVCFQEFISLKQALSAQTITIKEREVRIKKASEQTKRENIQLNNSSNANRRILKKNQQSQFLQNRKGKKSLKGVQQKPQQQTEKQQTRVEIHKKIQKMKKKKYTKKEINEQVSNIKQTRKNNLKDTNIFNQF